MPHLRRCLSKQTLKSKLVMQLSIGDDGSKQITLYNYIHFNTFTFVTPIRRHIENL